MSQTVQMAAQSTYRTGEERRAHVRYPVKLPLRYVSRADKLVSVSGEGTTVNISSTGMLFRSSIRLDRPDKVIAAVEWPRTPADKPVILLLQGRVVWMQGPQIAITVSHYGFLPEEDHAALNEIQLEDLATTCHLTPTRPGSSFYSGVRQWKKGVVPWK